MSALWTLDLSRLLDLLRSRALSSRQVVEACLDRIAGVNPKVNALCEVLASRALAEADAADARSARGSRLGPLHGVPFSVKCNVDLAGHASHAGVPALTATLAATDAPHVAQIRRAGAIALARGNMPDFGFRWHTDSSLQGATLNPWAAGVTPGGSSGGDAVAVATGMVPFALGNDFGGSLRFPALCCGIAALKPGLGRVARATPGTPVEPPISFQMFSVQGILARRVGDLACVYAHLCADDASDPWWVPSATFTAPVDGPPRIAAWYGGDGWVLDAHARGGMDIAVDALRRTGHAVEVVAPPMLEEALETYMQIVAADVRDSALGAVERLASPATRRFVESFMALVPDSTLSGYIAALARRNAIARAWAQFQSAYPVIVAPVSTTMAFAPDFDASGTDAVQALTRAMAMSVSANLLGLPAVALPVATSGGLPQGVQVIGPRHREDLCLAVSRSIELQLGASGPIDPRG